MPICPGCERWVSYDELPRHERYCTQLCESDEARMRSLAALDERITETERRLYRQIKAIEAELDISTSRTDGEQESDSRSRRQ